MDYTNRLVFLFLFTLMVFVLVRFLLPLLSAVSGFLIHLFHFLDRVILPM